MRKLPKIFNLFLYLLQSLSRVFYLVNVYLPYFSHENYDSYMYYLGKLNAIVSYLPSTKIAFLGDFNPHINGIFYKELVNFCQNMNLVISDCKLLGENSKTFTFVSDAHNSTSWLDHVLSSHTMHSCIDSITVLDKLPCSDHLPVSISLVCNWSNNPLLGKLTREYSNKTCNWSKITSSDLKTYSRLTKYCLKHINIPQHMLSCNTLSCTSTCHKDAITQLYDGIIKCLLNSSNKCIPQSRSHQKNSVVPGWTDLVKELHYKARSDYILWRDLGKPRSGPSCEEMRRSRLSFKYALRQCRVHEEQIKADKLANDLKNKDSVSFWKAVSRTSKVNTPLPENVNGACGSTNVVNMWKQHYEMLLNCVTTDINKSYVLSKINKTNEKGICISHGSRKCH